MRILLIGATGNVGSQILREAAARDHNVTAVARHVDGLKESEHVRAVAADAKDARRMAELAAGQDALISALSPRAEGGPEQYLAAVRGVLQGATEAEVPYALFVVGASSLEDEAGHRMIEDVLAHREELDRTRPGMVTEAVTVVEARDLVADSNANWSLVSPAGHFEEGKRTGQYRLGDVHPVLDASGQGRISVPDFAVAVVDAVEQGRELYKQFNVGY